MDVIAGLDMMVQRGQWDKAIETAEQQVRRTAFSNYLAIIRISIITLQVLIPIYISLQMALCQSKGAYRKSELGARTSYLNVN